jgi:hypothetical protein
MKCVATFVVVVAVLFVASSAKADLVAVGDQLVLNGGMEDPGWGTPTSWNKLQGGFDLFSGYVHSGSYRLAAYYAGKGNQDHWYDGFASDVTSLVLSGWMRSEDTSGGIGRMVVETYSMPNYQAGQLAFADSDGTTEWKQYSVSVPISHGALESNYISVTLSALDYNKAVWFDDFTLTAVGVPEPAGCTLLTCGLVALLAYAWRKRR